MDGSTTVRYPTSVNAPDEQGFSLPEALFALLLMALSSSALLHYHRALSISFSQQWQQREAWRVAAQRLMGHETEGWQSQFTQRMGPTGCRVESVTVSGPQQRSATLQRLTCQTALP